MGNSSEEKNGNGFGAPSDEKIVASCQERDSDSNTSTPDSRKSACIEFGWCGFGVAAWELRLGWMRVWGCRGSLASMLRELPKIRDALRAARDELGRKP